MIAPRENWQESPGEIAQMSLWGWRNAWQAVGWLTATAIPHPYTIAVCKAKSLSYRIGREIVPDPAKPDAGYAEIIAYLRLRQPEANAFGYPHLVGCEEMVMQEDEQFLEVGVTLLRFILHSGMTLLSDQGGYFGPRSMWTKLSSICTVIVDVVDTENDTVIERAVTLPRGKAIAAGRPNIRFIMRTIRPILKPVQAV